VKLVPSIPVAARLNRTFLKVAAAWWDVENISHIVDLGSGLPTKGPAPIVPQCALSAPKPHSVPGQLGVIGSHVGACRTRADQGLTQVHPLALQAVLSRELYL
jgi:hypothetical protein